MSRFENRAELAAKIYWEGTLEDALDYGIKASDMPEGDRDLEIAWANMENAWEYYTQFRTAVLRLLPEEQ